MLVVKSTFPQTGSTPLIVRNTSPDEPIVNTFQSGVASPISIAPVVHVNPAIWSNSGSHACTSVPIAKPRFVLAPLVVEAPVPPCKTATSVAAQVPAVTLPVSSINTVEFCINSPVAPSYLVTALSVAKAGPITSPGVEFKSAIDCAVTFFVTLAEPTS